MATSIVLVAKSNATSTVALAYGGQSGREATAGCGNSGGGVTAWERSSVSSFSRSPNGKQQRHSSSTNRLSPGEGRCRMARQASLGEIPTIDRRRCNSGSGASSSGHECNLASCSGRGVAGVPGERGGRGTLGGMGVARSLFLTGSSASCPSLSSSLPTSKTSLGVGRRALSTKSSKLAVSGGWGSSGSGSNNGDFGREKKVPLVRAQAQESSTMSSLTEDSSLEEITRSVEVAKEKAKAARSLAARMAKEIQAGLEETAIAKERLPLRSRRERKVDLDELLSGISNQPLPAGAQPSQHKLQQQQQQLLQQQLLHQQLLQQQQQQQQAMAQPLPPPPPPQPTYQPPPPPQYQQYQQPTPVQQYNYDQSSWQQAAQAEAISRRPPSSLGGGYNLPSGLPPTVEQQFLLYLAKTNNNSPYFISPPGDVMAGSSITIYYNKRNSPIKNTDKFIIKGGFNAWRLDVMDEPLEASDLHGPAGSQWLMKRLMVPLEAYIFSFVVTDGNKQWDNNNMQDYTFPVIGGLSPQDFDALVEMRAKEAEELRQRLEREAEERRLRQLQAEEEERLEKVKAVHEEEKRRWAEEEIFAERRRREEKRKQAEEDERLQAQATVNDLIRQAKNTLSIAAPSKDWVYYTEHSTTTAGSMTLYYNKHGHTLRHEGGDPVLHYGFNNWSLGATTSVRMEHAKEASTANGAYWFKADIPVSDPDAVIIDFVVSSNTRYDNNDNQDYHVPLTDVASIESQFRGMERKLIEQMREERERRERADDVRREKTEKLKCDMRIQTKKSFLQQQQRFLYTEPAELRAGEPATVYYNADSSVLKGRREIWMRGSWNRWNHILPIRPTKMEPVPGSSLVRASVQIPRDAFVMDFVFSDTGAEEGGQYDNNAGLDYHLPVSNSLREEPSMHVVHISVEMAPVAKVGGLADVVTSLGRAVKELGHKVDVILPKYDVLRYADVVDMEEMPSFNCSNVNIRVWRCQVEGLNVYLLEPQNGFFWQNCVYGKNNDAQRFFFFSQAALEFLAQTNRNPDIIHCHDWSTAPVARLYWQNYHSIIPKAKVIFTIHNLQYGQNLIGEAMSHCQMATTVSPTYANEVRSNGAIAAHQGKFYGIRNGIDLDIWDPADDRFLPMMYTWDEAREGKRAAREELRRRLNLDGSNDRPIVAAVTRLTAQKGIHLIKHGVGKTLERGGQYVLLGSAPDPKVHGDFQAFERQLQSQNCNNARLCLNFDEDLSHLIYAAADFILVPSMFEPCGLTQLIAMRYGAIPIVRRTGGLNDTVFDLDNDKQRAAEYAAEPNGFNFEGTDSGGLDYALNRALDFFWNDNEGFRTFQRRVMQQDWSWSRPAMEYLELYYAAMKR